MGYISTALSKDRKHVYVWERHNDNRVLKKYTAPYYFYMNDENGEVQSLDGKKVTKKEFTDADEFFNIKKALAEQKVSLYESDIPVETKVLSEHYMDSTGGMNLTLFDIEVDYDPKIGFASPENPYAPINAVALYHHYKDNYIVLAVPPKGWDGKLPKELQKDNILLFKNEKELLIKLLEEIVDSDIISGWHSSYFDVPYVYQRVLKTLGKKYTKLLCFEDAPKYPYVKNVKKKYGGEAQTVILSGRISLDYLELFKKFDNEIRSSHTLEAIAEEELEDLEKLEYDGSLYELYNNDFPKFLKYNIRDTQILKGLEDKLKYVQIAVDLSRLSTVNLVSILGTVQAADNAIVNYCHNNLNRVVKDKDEKYKSEKFKGADVLEPQKGLHEWVSSVDVKSLYPNSIRTVNISPDTIMGQFIENEKAFEKIRNKSDDELTLIYENGFDETMSGKEWGDYFSKNDMSISGYGTVFSQNEMGFLPAILESWYFDRLKAQSKSEELMKELENLEETSPEYKEKKKEQEHLDRYQYLKKIQLNSMYGVLGNEFFRFYDIRLAESTTKTGREILTHMAKYISKIFEDQYKYPSDSAIYGDTDSIYFKTYAENAEEAKMVGKAVAKRVNKSFKGFIQKSFFAGEKFDSHIICEHEIVADKGIFVAKKLYALHLIYKDGFDVDKMKVMGLQIKKSTLPKKIRKKLTKIIEKFLKDTPLKEIKKEIVEYKEYLKTCDIMEIGIPTGINNVENYTEGYNNDPNTFKDIPGHVRAAILYNKCINSYDDKEAIPIRSEMKIKKYYLTKPISNKFTSIAVPTELSRAPEWMKSNFMKYIDINRQIETLVDKPLTNILGCMGEIVPSKKTVLADDLLEF